MCWDEVNPINLWFYVQFDLLHSIFHDKRTILPIIKHIDYGFHAIAQV